MTVLEAIHKGTGFLTARGVESPRLQAEWLLAGTLGLPRLQLYLQFDRELTHEQADQARGWFQRRARREPLQHILGTVVFCGLELRVSANALIPRPETEILAEAALEYLQSMTSQDATVLDFGTGTGCLAVVLTARTPGLRCHALDISAAALESANENVRLHSLAERCRLFLGDGFAALPPEERYALIVSNPPYIPSAEIECLEPEVRDHDPRVALDGGLDGLEVYRRLAAEAGPWLRPNGRLFLELGDGQADGVAALLEQNNWIVERIRPDYNGTPRVMQAGRRE